MGYYSDWIDYERQAAEAEAYSQEHYPDCTQERECLATEHRLTCRRWRRERYPETYAKIDAMAARRAEGGA